MVRNLPIGFDNFKDIRDQDRLYVDKTDMIPQIISGDAKVYLYTRPRRFGKSLNLSMLDAFFNIRYPKDNTWFDGLKVSDYRECDEHRNAYPVIYLDFKNLGVSNMKTFDSDLIDEMSNLFRNHKYLLNSEILDDVDKEYFDDVFRRKLDPITLRKFVSVLSRMLNEHHGTKVIILIDEYDNPIHNAFGKPHHQEILDSMRDILSSALKGNDSVQFGVVTGVMQIAKESLFSGLNNLRVNNVFSEDFDEMFGFTADEVKAIFEEYGHPEKFEEAREWYDGYRFGDADVYNPWSIINYISSGFVPKSYWLWEGNMRLISDAIGRNPRFISSVLAPLYNGETCRIQINERVTFSNIHLDCNLVSILVASGYFKAVFIKDSTYDITIVNKEVRDGWIEQILDDSMDPMGMNRISSAFLSGDPDAVRFELSESLDRITDRKVMIDEGRYQSLVLGLLDCLKDTYYVRAEYAGGNGYADIVLIPRNGKGPSAVIELKNAAPGTDDGSMDAISRNALEQIVNRRYFSDLSGDIHLYGIATRQNDVFISYEKIYR
ncbi:MAG: AAA family ATPase [Candidatus Methanomethylophilaceae archaeon]|nr:AAA family ATPase [Candidatus Methanomethylophilaceae archaeon]